MFWSLHAARQHGMSGPQPIAVTEIMAYCAMAGISDPCDRMALLGVIQAMDGGFMEYVAERRKQEEAKKGRGKKK